MRVNVKRIGTSSAAEIRRMLARRQFINSVSHLRALEAATRKLRLQR